MLIKKLFRTRNLLFLLVVLSFVLYTGLKSASSVNEWTEIEIDPFRFGHNCIDATDDNIYCIGGRPSPFANFEPSKNEMLDTETNTWVQKQGLEDVDNPWGKVM
jgi:hypothetical protein